ncbi:MAG TPA: type III-B CRISPR module-associated Cmr3 family protein [Hyphomicrobiaceae bacterium]|nr:type III-B CRISPR module-associated Cmr3 family protein [Hyphomicrobiaceae bacterium]
MSTSTCLALVPRDGFFCKDGRGWHTSASGRGHGLDWPWPSTILGALRTAWGRSDETRSGAVFDAYTWRTRTADIRLGRTLVLRRPVGAAWAIAHTLWPVPADAVWLDERKSVHRLEPRPAKIETLGRDDDDARESLMRPVLDDAGKPRPPPRWWSCKAFAAWLAGESVAAEQDHAAFHSVRRFQAHVRIRPDEVTAEEGVLFSHDVLETLDRDAEWAIGVEAVIPQEDLSAVATLGSDSRLARIEPLPHALFEPSEEVVNAFRTPSAGLRLAAVTPLCFERGWLPDGLERNGEEYRGRLQGAGSELVLRAAFVPRPVRISGWDMAAGVPKPTSRMVPPGAVYFFERADGQPFTEDDASAFWLAAVGTRTDEGYGRVVPGIWNPIRSSQ